jgi:predicted dienelactone hydrolase
MNDPHYDRRPPALRWLPPRFAPDPRPRLDRRFDYPIARTGEVDCLELPWFDRERDRAVPAIAYLPAEGSDWPVVIFSHGVGNSRRGYDYFGREWAANGYLALHVQHHGSDDEVLRQKGVMALIRSTTDRGHWQDRPRDISFAIDQLERISGGSVGSREEEVLQGRFDLSRVGVAGHSYGAFAALAVSGFLIDLQPVGGVTSFRDPRVKAAIAISVPRMDGADKVEAFAPIDIPMLHMTGTRDRSYAFRTFLRHRRMPFDRISAPHHYLVVLNDAGHSSFSSDERRPSRFHDLHIEMMQVVTTAFWNGWIRDELPARRFLEHDLASWCATAANVEAR